MTVAELPIKINRGKIAEFCRAHGIRKLSLFGSVVHDDFDPKRSDVDVLVEFLPNQTPGWEFFIRYTAAVRSTLGARIVALVRGHGNRLPGSFVGLHPDRIRITALS